MTVTLRPVNKGDTDVLFGWQQEPSIRKHFRNPHAPTKLEHEEWVADKLNDRQALFMMIAERGSPVGVIRLDPTGDCSFEVSIIVAHEYQGRGIGKLALALARELRPAANLYANIKTNNAPSVALFKGAGYIAVGQETYINCSDVNGDVVVLHPDGGGTTGLGHAWRCVGLARGLEKVDLVPIFFVSPDSDLEGFIRAEGFRVYTCPNTSEAIVDMSIGAKVLAIDSYRLQKSVLSKASNNKQLIIMFDDKREPVSGVDMIINGSPAAKAEDFENGRNKTLLLGPAYQIVRSDLKRRNSNRKLSPKRLLVTIGGSDPLRICTDLIDMLEGQIAPAQGGLQIDFVLGPAMDKPKTPCSHIRLMQNPPDMAALISNADIAISGGGQSLFELLYCGVPTLALEIADNQSANLAALADADTVISCGRADKEGWREKLTTNLLALLNDAERRQCLSQNGMHQFDQLGAERIAKVIASRIDQIRSYSSDNPRTISIVVDNNSWILPYAEELVALQNSAGDKAELFRRYDDLPTGDVAFFLGCISIASPEHLARNRRNLIVHESALPKGKGFAPVAWQVLEGARTIPICLVEAVESADSGNIIIQSSFIVEPDELLGEIRHKQGQASVTLCRRFLAEAIPPAGEPQVGEETFYSRRTPDDSQLDPFKSIAEQFELLKITDNERYPAFFDFRGHRYQIRINKMDEKKLT